MTPLPPMQWDGDALVPLPNFAKRADSVFVVGEVYRLAPVEDRSPASHRHFFATVNNAWKNLPEDMAERFPTSEHLRKWCLVKAGYRDERTFVASSKAEAVRLAAFVRPIDDYAIVTVNGNTVTQYTAKSQAGRAMNKADFQKSKDAVLDILAEMIGTDPTTLARSEAA